ncbi:MAG: hypothetical protein WBN68_11080 [Sedimenticolaceae bacterium]
MFKTIFLTFSLTLTAVGLAASLFLNSILGLFGLAATSVGTLSSLQASQQIVEKMKQRHLRKKARVSKRFVKRSGKRVASAALAAATVGTVAVAVAMTSMEISDYCEEKETLQKDANLLYGTDVAFDLETCIEESQDDANAILSEATDTVMQTVEDAFDKTGEYSREAWANVKRATGDALDSTSGALSDIWESAKSWFAD